MTRGADLQKVAREGKRIRTVHLDVRVLASPFEHPRIGFVVPKYGRTAVRRNQLKRRLRELARLRLLPALRTLAAVDVVIKVRPDGYGASFAELARQIEQARARLVDGRVLEGRTPSGGTTGG